MSIKGWSLEHTYTQLPDIFYRHQRPAGVPAPEMVIFNHKLAGEFGLNAGELADTPEIFTGTELPAGATPIAQAYAGYQFGHFTMLGDGRAILLGEQVTPGGHRFDIQLKGCGRTPYSRRGDGLAALAPMLREYIISEAMFALGIPTTRSLAVVLTGEDVVRERVLKGAVLTRIASSHIRVGTFDFASAYGSKEDLQSLADYCISRHFPQIQADENKYLLLLREACRLQAALIAKWQMTGFIHGVMNTDNMAISGEAIDYGPCAFMDVYHPDTVFSSIDASGRYAYKNQPAIGAWNLSRFAESLLPLIDAEQDKAAETAQGEIASYWARYHENWLDGMRAKLGLATEEPEDAGLIAELLNLMSEHKLDFTNTFRARFEAAELEPWREKWRERLGREHKTPGDAAQMMDRHNPAVIPRNHRVEEALTAAEEGDLSVMHSLLSALQNPYEESETYVRPPAKEACGYKTFCGT
ncbi:MAG: YdiU family protein [Oscillospiraceae bacterium]|nr:YdiU family protein [Oscillospiraceae bacterium]